MALTAPNDNKQELIDSSFTAELWDWSKSLLIALAAVISVNQFMVTQCKVVGYSMQPTLQQGERLFINRLIYNFRSPHRGEIITFVDPNKQQSQAALNLVKRVVAVAGDEVEVRGGQLLVNGAFLDEQYTDTTIENGDWGPYKVAKGQVFVLGDNRHSNASLDSRIFGSVPTHSIIGRAEFIIWPLNKMTGL
jgi:signal peptidase I